MENQEKIKIGFYIPQNTARIHLRKTFSNVFVTLVDLNDRVIVCKSSGSSGIKGSKRRKRVPLALESIVESLHSFFKLHKILNVEIVVKMRIGAHFHNLVRELSHYGIILLSYLFGVK